MGVNTLIAFRPFNMKKRPISSTINRCSSSSSILLLLVCIATFYLVIVDGKEPPSPLYGPTFHREDPIYKKIKVEWSKTDELILELPKGLDCYSKCENVNLCQMGYDMIYCFDQDRDLKISEEEFNYAIEKELHWFKKAIFKAMSRDFIGLFDGEYNGERDRKVDLMEVVYSDKLFCEEYQEAYDNLCKKCKRKDDTKNFGYHFVEQGGMHTASKAPSKGKRNKLF